MTQGRHRARGVRAWLDRRRRDAKWELEQDRIAAGGYPYPTVAKYLQPSGPTPPSHPFGVTQLAELTPYTQNQRGEWQAPEQQNPTAMKHLAKAAYDSFGLWWIQEEESIQCLPAWPRLSPLAREKWKQAVELTLMEHCAASGLTAE